MWDHPVTRRELSYGFTAVSICHFCGTALRKFEQELSESAVSPDDIFLSASQMAGVCPECGWWTVVRDEHTYLAAAGLGQTNLVLAAAGSLRNFSCADVTVPIEHVRQYLRAKYESRFDLHPRVFEETVASVFGDLGYTARTTAYTGDGGIDIVLLDQSGNEIGVQVKRWRRSIDVEQIRSLVGALVLKGSTRGIFVTTSSFQKGASSTASVAELMGHPIELIDGARFLDALGIANRKMLSVTPLALGTPVALKVVRYQTFSCHWDGPVVTIEADGKPDVAVDRVSDRCYVDLERMSEPISIEMMTG